MTSVYINEGNVNQSLLCVCEGNLKKKKRCAIAVPSPTMLVSNETPAPAISTIARVSLMSVKQHSSSQLSTHVCVLLPKCSQSSQYSPIRLSFPPLYSRTKGTSTPIPTRIRVAVSMRNVNPRQRVMRVTPSIRIPTMPARRDRTPTLKARGAVMVGVNWREIQATAEERRAMEQRR